MKDEKILKRHKAKTYKQTQRPYKFHCSLRDFFFLSWSSSEFDELESELLDEELSLLVLSLPVLLLSESSLPEIMNID
jgi:hypothetical protein